MIHYEEALYQVYVPLPLLYLLNCYIVLNQSNHNKKKTVKFKPINAHFLVHVYFLHSMRIIACFVNIGVDTVIIVVKLKLKTRSR